MRNYKIFNLQEGESFVSRVKSTFLEIQKQLADKTITKLDIHIHSTNAETFKDECDILSAAIKESFKNKIPATTFISNHPADNNDVLISCQFYTHSSEKINFKKILDHHYVTIEHKNGIELISGGIHFNENSILLNIQRAFDFAEQLLMAEDMNFGHIVRQWDYITAINENSEYDGSSKNNLEIFNEIKSFFLEESLFKNGYPSVSDNGIYQGGIVIDFMAFNNYEHFTSVNIKSDYYLPFSDQAKYLYTDKDEVWISGSCLNYDTSKDIEKQILKALEETFKLIENKNLVASNINIPEPYNFKDGFKLIKAYVRHESYNKEVKDIIHSVLPNTECIIINTEFYSKDKLIEIESFTSI
ncbi:hypothetical protein [Plebeiibacterium sediminum]|uniref:Uncharacterized protein n=1 Tax=Plebeiibacterium sediminum TaxID=2992112 RepID=A0AAE3M0W1_9BACT|nr:hypothetical protein [Plebeiobacterium sediminum]MCW3785144.1 hypothetical protein [Plebeiobacterium sediminum]